MARPPISVRDWRRQPPLRLTVAEKLDACWCWVNCGAPLKCGHRAAVAIAPFVIRWGPDAWPEMLRRHGRCSKCGHKGVSLTHASWGGMDVGWAEFPVDQMAQITVSDTPRSRPP
jgi:hypothetical protein